MKEQIEKLGRKGPMVAKTGLAALARGFVLFFPLPFILKRLSYCRKHTVTHSFCLHQDIMKLSCTDTTVNVVYGLFIILSVMGVDSLFVGFSYVLILRAVLELSSRGAALKAFNTCISHLCAVLVFYLPLIGLSVVHRLSGPTSLLHVIMANIYLLLPPVVNPIVYGAKTKEIRSRVFHIFSQNGREKPDGIGLIWLELEFDEAEGDLEKASPRDHGHTHVMKLACADIHVNIIYGLIVIISAIGLDSLLISLSYLLILKTVLGLTREAQAKAFGTCVSHVCAVFIFYVPFIGLSMVHRFGKRQDSLLPVILANTYLLVPPVLNPIVYGVKTKEIRQRILRLFHVTTHTLDP
ncbi:hypothetical protein MG293_012353 [Ovis ammon polii]|uniref:G-protein coupled receptors family 1 profile domain-containing protein n=1 Tax=Ovis ammon polii TaxID=230172 RepID=A0AAD4Y4L8_OVIAM|nr:hypothetical protein MG293_012353 [Ovis ammon polii]